MDDLRFRTRQGDHLAGQFGDGEFVRVADVHRTGEVVGRVVHHAHHAFDQVVDVLERTALSAVAVDRDIVAPQRLDDEIRDHAAVVDVHFRTVGVEYADDLHGNAVFAVVAHKERLGAAFALVVARADAQRVDVAPVILALGVDQRVAVDLRGRGLEDFRPVVFGHAQHVDRADHRRLGGFDRVVLVVDRRSGAGEVVDLLDLGHVGIDDVVADDLEIGVRQQVSDVAFVTGEIVVDADDVVTFREQPFAQMGADRIAGLHSRRGDVLQLLRQRERRHAARAARFVADVETPCDRLPGDVRQPEQGGRHAQPLRHPAQHRPDPFALSPGGEHRSGDRQYLRRHFVAGARARGVGELPRPESRAGGQPRGGGDGVPDLCDAAAPFGRDARHVARRQRRRILHAAVAERSGAEQPPRSGLLGDRYGHRRHGDRRLRARIRERRGGHCEPDPEILRHGRHRRRSFPYEQKSLSVRFAQAQGVENRRIRPAQGQRHRGYDGGQAVEILPLHRTVGGGHPAAGAAALRDVAAVAHAAAQAHA